MRMHRKEIACVLSELVIEKQKAVIAAQKELIEEQKKQIELLERMAKKKYPFPSFDENPE